MRCKGNRCFRILQLMPLRARNRNHLDAAFTNKESKAKPASSASARSYQRQPLLPEIPARASSVVIPRSSGHRKTRTDVSHHRTHAAESSTSRAKGNRTACSNFDSDILVAKLGSLSLGPTQRKHSSRQSVSIRPFSTYYLKGVEDIAELIKSEGCKNIIVMAGAGISTPSGIPDFRTPGTGLYDNLAEYNLPEPSAIFDIHFFNYNPVPFFRLARDLYPGNYPPNFVHYFIRMLHEKRKLLRMFTQNIDALERAAGIPETRLIEAHGSFATATCRKCKAKYSGSDIKGEVMMQVIPKCKKDGCTGIIKPDIVFFGEDLPKKFFEYPKHFANCDLLIVLGTSLEVYPFAGLVSEVSRSTPRLLINRDIVGPFVKGRRRPNDVVVKGDIVDNVRHLVELLGWTKAVDISMIEDK